MLVLGGAVASTDPLCAKMEVFGFSTANSFAPRSKGAGVQLGTHDLNDSPFVRPKVCFNGFKRGTVFPGHLNDPRQIFCTE